MANILDKKFNQFCKVSRNFLDFRKQKKNPLTSFVFYTLAKTLIIFISVIPIVHNKIINIFMTCIYIQFTPHGPIVSTYAR